MRIQKQSWKSKRLAELEKADLPVRGKAILKKYHLLK